MLCRPDIKLDRAAGASRGAQFRHSRSGAPEHEKNRLVDQTKRFFAVHGHQRRPPRERNGPRKPNIARSQQLVKARLTIFGLSTARGAAHRGPDHGPGGSARGAREARPTQRGAKPTQTDLALPGAPSGGGRAGGGRGEHHRQPQYRRRGAASGRRRPRADTQAPAPGGGKAALRPRGGRGGSAARTQPGGDKRSPPRADAPHTAQARAEQGRPSGRPQRSKGGAQGGGGSERRRSA